MSANSRGTARDVRGRGLAPLCNTISLTKGRCADEEEQRATQGGPEETPHAGQDPPPQVERVSPSSRCVRRRGWWPAQHPPHAHEEKLCVRRKPCVRGRRSYKRCSHTLRDGRSSRNWSPAIARRATG